MWHYMVWVKRSESEFTLHKFCSLIYNPNKNSEDSIAFLFLCFHTCYNLKLRHLLLLWDKLFSFLLTEAHTSLSLKLCCHDFELALQTGGKYRRQVTAVCAIFQNLCSYKIIRHVNLYTLTHIRTFIDEKDAHCFNNCLSRHLYFLLSLWCFPVKHSVLPAKLITKIHLVNSCSLQRDEVHSVLLCSRVMPPCIHKLAARCKRIIFMLEMSFSPENFAGRLPNAGLHVTLKNKICCTTTSAVQFVTSHIAEWRTETP